MTDSRPGPDIGHRCSCGVLHPDRLDCPGPPAADVKAHADSARAVLAAVRWTAPFPPGSPTPRRNPDG